MNWSDYSYASDGSIMVVLIMILGALVVYLLWDRNTKTDSWDYDVESRGFGQQGLDDPFDDPEVPNRPKKPTKKMKPKKKMKKTVVKKQKKRKLK